MQLQGEQVDHKKDLVGRVKRLGNAMNPDAIVVHETARCWPGEFVAGSVPEEEMLRSALPGPVHLSEPVPKGRRGDGPPESQVAVQPGFSRRVVEDQQRAMASGLSRHSV